MSVHNMQPENLRNRILSGDGSLEIIDVREQDEYDKSHIRGARLMPLGSIKNRLDDIDWNSDVVFVCRSGIRSMKASNIASKHGKNVYNLNGGMMQFANIAPECVEIASD